MNSLSQWESEEEWEMLKKVLRQEGFESLDTGEWMKTFMSNRWVYCCFDGINVQFNFNDEANCYVSPEFVIKFFINRPDKHWY